MKKVMDFLQNRQTRLSAILLFLFSVAVVVYLIPREAQFQYEFQKGKPWLYEDLVAPFDFAIRKTFTEIEQEKEELRQEKTLFLERREAGPWLEDFAKQFLREWRRAAKKGQFTEGLTAQVDTTALGDSLLRRGKFHMKQVFRQGILKPLEEDIAQDYGEVLITRNGVSKSVNLSSLLTMAEASQRLEDSLQEEFPEPIARFVHQRIVPRLNHNIILNEERTRNYLRSQLEQILPTKGIVQKGEIIIFKGNLVEGEKYAKLVSLKQAYEGYQGDNRTWYLLLGGQVFLVGILFLVLYLLIYEFRRQVLEDITRLTFILVNMLLMVFAARVVVGLESTYVYIVPFAILPLVLRSFFDRQLTLFIHIITMIITGFIVQNSFEFMILQIVAGVFSIVLVDRLYKRSQLFLTAGKITLVYCITYLSMAVIREGGFADINYWILVYFMFNGLLTLVSFPLIFFQEKLFGFVSDVTLLELSDTNSPLLRKLAQKAPGSFQHSLQVANLAEAAVNSIQGNTLLVRTGALYHDIGKMESPMYYIENQATGINPHDELSFEESAEIIISHVTRGIKMAKRNNLPDILIDFIRTHHGTTTVMYFYSQYIKNFPQDQKALEKFTYPGPKPFSKETAVLMMADAVEAASRSLSKPDHQSLDDLVEKLIDHQIDSGQFENAPITLREIRLVKKIFKKMLMNIYHVRIAYPS